MKNEQIMKYETVGDITPMYRDPSDPYSTDGSAGFDLMADVGIDPITLLPGDRVLVSTGYKFEIPQCHEMQIRPRSGLALKHGVTVLNSPGTIDSDYRGVVGVILINHGKEPFVIGHGDRIAQAVISKYVKVRLVSDNLETTARGAGGFGSTGVS